MRRKTCFRWEMLRFDFKFKLNSIKVRKTNATFDISKDGKWTCESHSLILNERSNSKQMRDQIQNKSNSKQLWDKIQNKAQNQVKMHLWMTFDVVLFLLRFNFVILTSLSPRSSSLSLSSVTHSSWKFLMWPWRDKQWRNNFSLLLNPVPTSDHFWSSVEADVQAAKHPAEPLSPRLH